MKPFTLTKKNSMIQVRKVKILGEDACMTDARIRPYRRFFMCWEVMLNYCQLWTFFVRKLN